MRFRYPMLCILAAAASRLMAHEPDSLAYLRGAEKNIRALQQRAFHSRDEKERLEGNRQLLQAWDAIVEKPGALFFPFDSLEDLSILTSGDGALRVITWNLHRDDGTHNYFGYVLAQHSKRIRTGFLRHRVETAYEHFKLLDRSATVRSPETYVGSPDKWFGMLYTAMIECDGYYTLLGWDGNDRLTQRKFVDVLWFRGDGTPVFGKDVFRFPRKNPRRLMFQYSADVTMSLRYNEKRRQIVYSHLASRQEGSLLDNQFQYYGPDGSFDALEQKNGKWITIEDIDARNERSKNDNAVKPDPKNQKPIFKPK